MTADRILVSACLLGKPVRYNGSAKKLEDELLAQWIAEGRVVSVCPEVLAGLPTPRPPAEIAGKTSGDVVPPAHARVIEIDGTDVTAVYASGAEAALEQAVRHGCRFALLTDGSPSCGSTFIYDGSFTGRQIAGEGIVTALLQEHGIEVFSQSQIRDLADRLNNVGTVSPTLTGAFRTCDPPLAPPRTAR